MNISKSTPIQAIKSSRLQQKCDFYVKKMERKIISANDSASSALTTLAKFPQEQNELDFVEKMLNKAKTKYNSSQNIKMKIINILSENKLEKPMSVLKKMFIMDFEFMNYSQLMDEVDSICRQMLYQSFPFNKGTANEQITNNLLNKKYIN